MKFIYVVEDHDVIRIGVKEYLEMYGYNVMTFANLKNAEEAIEKSKPDLLIQDVMLPDGDGFDFIARIKKKHDIPVVFMTAKISEEDRIKGFELGADDYIVKPFSPKELVLRIQAIFKRLDQKNESREKKLIPMKQVFCLEDNKLEINQRNHCVFVNGKDVGLTSAEERVLEFLSKEEKPINRSLILKECFDYNSDSYSRIVDTHIKNLRAKLGNSKWIYSVRGIGYQFIGKLEEQTEA